MESRDLSVGEIAFKINKHCSNFDTVISMLKTNNKPFRIVHSTYTNTTLVAEETIEDGIVQFKKTMTCIFKPDGTLTCCMYK